MRFPLASLIVGSNRIMRVETSLSRDVALERLQARIMPWFSVRDGLRGRATEDGVSLYLRSSPFHPPYRGHTLRAQFSGRLESTPTGAALVGTVGMLRELQVVMILAVCFGMLMACRDVISPARSDLADPSLVHALRWLLVLPGVVALNYIGRLISSGDEDRLRTTIQWTLEHHVAEQTHAASRDT
jgi:hypothetical protein